jgi:uncharacterized membrane protein YhaH (DUF805 family)
MNIFNNFKLNFKKGLQKFNFKGRSSRKEFLQITFFTPLVILTVLFLSISLGEITGLESISIIGTIIGFIALFFNAFAALFALGRRLQDLNVNGLFAIPLIFLAPILYIIGGLFLMFLPSTNHNKYGPNISNLNITSDVVENFIYYKFFMSNPRFPNMTIEQNNLHNQRQAQIYLKLIPTSDLQDLENLLKQKVNPNIDFSKSLPTFDLNNSKYSEFIKKHNLENFDYNKLFSEFQHYANISKSETGFNKSLFEKEING